MDSRIRIELLGGLRLVRGDQVITRFRTQKAAWLLAYLAVNAGKPIHRELLADLLWPESDMESGRNRVKQELSCLRRLLEDGGGAVEIFQADRSAIQLDPFHVE